MLITRPVHTSRDVDLPGVDLPRATQGDALACLPSAYRSWLPGVVRVGAALVLTVAVGLLLRALPESGPAVRKAAPPATATPSATATPPATAPGGGRAGEPGHGLHLLMTAPAGTRTVTAAGPIALHADVSDGEGGDPVAVDLSWEVRRGATGAVVFRAHGADAEIPAGTLGDGIYHVIVQGVAGATRAGDLGALVVVSTRA